MTTTLDLDRVPSGILGCDHAQNDVVPDAHAEHLRSLSPQRKVTPQVQKLSPEANYVEPGKATDHPPSSDDRLLHEAATRYRSTLSGSIGALAQRSVR